MPPAVATPPTAPVTKLYGKHETFVNNVIFPLFHVGYFAPIFLALQRRIVNWETATTLFADQILTPQATFHTRDELER